MNERPKTPQDVEEYLRDHKVSGCVATRVRTLVEAVGGLEPFVKASRGELLAAYRRTKPDSTVDLGDATMDAVALAARYIRDGAGGNAADAAREATLRGFDSEPFETAVLEKAVSLAQVAGVRMLTIGRLKFLCQIVREGGAK